MALANIAVRVAQMGSKVLMVDWDLEAPGLDMYFMSENARKNSKIVTQPAPDRTGLMGLLHDAFNRVSAAPQSDAWQNRTVHLDLPQNDPFSTNPTSSARVRLDFLPAGHSANDYADRLIAFSWPQFFGDARGGEWLEALRDQWAAEYDFVFIDSRTGLTDGGGVCTIQMPDILVLVFTASDQSLDGGLRVIAAAQRARTAFGYDRGPLAVVPVLSRWEGENEVDIGNLWMKRFDVELEPLTAPWLPKDFSPRRFLEKTRIPHVPRFSFGEPLPVLTHSLTDPSLPGLYFDLLARLIRSKFRQAGEIIDSTYKNRLPTTSGAKPIVLPYSSLGTLFKGRGDVIQRLHTALTRTGDTGGPLSSAGLYGLGGIGKTRVAVEYAWRHWDDYNALLLALADTPETLRRNLAMIANALVPTLDTTDDEVRFQATIDWLKTNPGWLLILDNVGTPSAMDEAERLMSALNGGHVIITSRLSNFSAHTEPIETDVLPVDDAAAFLLERTTSRRRAAEDDDAKAHELAVELGQLPLALEQAGAYISKHRLTLHDYLEQWRSSRREVLTWSDPSLTTYPDAIAITWQTSVTQLSDLGRRLLERLAWLSPERVPEALLDVPIPAHETEDLRNACDDLSSYSMVLREVDAPFFVVHRLVQDVTRRSLANGVRHSRLEEALNWIDAAFAGNPVDVRDWHKLDPLAPHARAVTAYADAAGISDPTSRLMNQLGLLLDAKALHADAEPLIRRALAIDESSHGPDHPNVAMGLNSLGSLLRATNRLTEAEPLILRALAIDEKHFGPDHPNVASTLNNLALLLQDTNRVEKAESLIRRALAIDEKSFGPDHPEVARSLNNLAILLRATNQLDEAELLIRRALEIDEKRFGSDHPNVARDLNNLAILLQSTDRLSEAEPLVRRALEIDEKQYSPDHPRVATRLNNLASLLLATGRISDAEVLARRALRILARFAKATGHDHPYFNQIRTNYRYILESRGESESSILSSIKELENND